MSLLLVLAGCSGGGNGTPTNTTANGSSTDSGTMGLNADLAMPGYEFSEGESYTYNVTFLGSQSTNTWDVVSVENGTVTVEGIQSTGNASQNATISGNQTSVFQAAAQESATGTFALSRSAMVFQGVGADASAGDVYQVTQDDLPEGADVEWTEATLAVEESRTVNGVDCTQYTLTANETGTENSFCLNTEYPFPVTLTSVSDGNTQLTMELLNSTRP